jgi:hypothetical protein
MENAFLPVEMICFPCYKNNTVNCSTFSRVCLTCTFSYLQLNLALEEREFYKKCLFCPSQTCLHEINHENSFKFDFPLMIADQKKNHTCPFCTIYMGTQIEIFHHIERFCPLMFIECSCSTIIQRRHQHIHLEDCIMHIKCRLCLEHSNRIEFYKKNEFKDHMKDVHHIRYCNLCNEFINEVSYNQHIESKCPERIIICTYCIQMIRAKEFNTHVYGHLDSVKKELEESIENHNEILERYNKIKRMFNPNIRYLEN